MLTSKGSRAAGDPTVDLEIEEVLTLLESLGSSALFRVKLNKEQDIVISWLGRHQKESKDEHGG